ncbi:MAG: M43 family zinc metalloprotease [Bacteroidia bacterium]
MKFFLRAILSLLLTPSFSMAQLNCGNTYAQERLFEQDPLARVKFEKVINQKTDQNSLGKNSSMAATYTIPVVFHVLHKGGTENISDAQLINAVAILNRDFQKQNADTANIVTQFKSLAADCSIQFSLATIDPNGMCTNGITRHFDLNTDWTISASNYIYTWDPAKYLNVYIVKSLPSGIAGYAYLPGTAPTAMDAVVILNSYVGSIGTGNNFTSRALTHEVGHWFNLQHTWGSTNNPGVACGDDGVTDTPVTKGHSQCSLNNAITCTSGITENIQNYMEYSYCTNMYTIGQKTRMDNCLNSSINGRNNLSTYSNLVATGVINPMPACAPIADFNSYSVTCVGNSLVMNDYSYNGSVTNWKWTSALASNTSTLQNGSLTFTASGLAPVKLVAANSYGSDSIVKTIVTVLSASGSGSTNLVQSFETGVFPDSDWIASVPEYGSPFINTYSVAATGTNCVWVNNYFDNPPGPVSFYSPAFNLNAMTSGQLDFKYAYTQQTASNNDQLKVFISTNCGASWTSLFSKSGSLLNTTGGTQTTAFLNPLPSQWSNPMINLQSYLGSQRVYFKFEFTPDVNGAGNNIFIDDINVSGIVSIARNSGVLNDMAVYPNPFNNNLTIKNNGGEKITSVKLYDISAREIMSVSNERLGSDIVEMLNINGLGNGIYFLQIKAGNSVKTVKVSKE